MLDKSQTNIIMYSQSFEHVELKKISENDSQNTDLKKCTLVQALRLCTARTAHRGNRDIDLPFHDHGTRRG